MRKEVWIVAAIAAACLVVAAAVLASGVLKPGKDGGEDEMVPMAGIRVEATGPANLTAYGLLVIPVNVTNLMDKAVDFRSMNMTLRLADGSEVPAMCNGPDSVAPMATGQFLIIVSSDRMLDISAVHLVSGREYLNVPVPKGTSNPDGNGGDGGQNGTAKDEPLVHMSLRSGRPFGPDPSPPYMLTYGVPVEGTLDTWVGEKADATRIGIMMYFVGLSNNSVFVNASYGNGEPQWMNLYGDGLLGCYGMIMTDPSNIVEGMGWTWTYAGSGEQHHNITLSVTTYSLGTHEVRFYAYDQETGRRISEVGVSSYTVLGSGGRFNDLNYMFDTTVETDLGTTFVPGTTYHFNITDTCLFPQYSGEVRSVLYLPYAVNVSIVNGDGSTTELAGDGSTYVISWNYPGGGVEHQVQLLVQIGEEGVPPSEYPHDVASYHVEDVDSGQVMSRISGDGRPEVRFELTAA